MISFFQEIAHKIISIGTSVILTLGIVSLPPEDGVSIYKVNEESNVEESVSVTDELRAELDALKKEVKMEREKNSVPSPVVADYAKELPKTDKTVNVTDIANEAELTGSDIFQMVAPSVVLVQASTGHGSGFVAEKNNYVITNAHVVGADLEVNLTLKDGTKVVGYVLGKNDSADIAVVFFENTFGIKPVEHGLSYGDSLPAGSDVYALGFPRYLTNTVTFTKGIVSANRQKGSGREYIQTDVTIHGGNSGGPLVNSDGKVIGMNTFGIGEGGGGLEFSIPIEDVRSWIPTLSKYGKSRYELHPIGSVKYINRSMIWKIEFNETLSCEQLMYRGDELELCDFYKKYKDDYKWSINEDRQN